MKDIYDALNHVSMDLNEYAPVPLEAGESERQTARLLAAEKKERPPCVSTAGAGPCWPRRQP